MKKFIFPLLAFLLLSCSSKQKIFDANEKKSVLIVINNESNVPLIEEYKNDILNSINETKKNKNIIFILQQTNLLIMII